MEKYINLKDYDYNLPHERIAEKPLPRGTAKLLHYKGGNIQHKQFSNIVGLLGSQHQLVYNNTKVLPARLHFYKDTGAQIEIFLLSPLLPTPEVTKAMLVTSECVWQCTIGNLKKWKGGQLLTARVQMGDDIQEIKAELLNREEKKVKFTWDSESIQFVDLVEALGKTPLPPYIKREANEEDKETYQTVYSKQEGAVAAPTAGLHFTDEILDKLRGKGVQTQEVTLHVGAGTFQPVTEENAIDHEMHQEQMEIDLATINSLISDKKIVAVGTTSMRTLESLYWFGVKLLNGFEEKFHIPKLFPYQDFQKELPSQKASFQAIANWMEKQNLERLFGTTEIFIFPSYQFRVCEALITNFHMPKSTLILLIASFIGEDWRKIYDEAMGNDYRFLSYGDSSFLER